MAGNPNPPTEHLKATQFKPGQSGNPGGISRETRRLIAENAEKATRIRAAFLAAIEAQIEAGQTPDLSGDALKLLKDTEDRGFGAPKTTAEIDANVNGDVKSEITVTFVDAKPDPDA